MKTFATFFASIWLVMQSSNDCSSQTVHAIDSEPKISISLFSLLVNDYDEAVKFYTEKLGFVKKSDIKFGAAERFVTIAPAGQKEVEFVLVQPILREDKELVGKQAGTRTLIVINTDDCRKVILQYKEKGVKIIVEPSEVPWGIQAQFLDLYGNLFVMLQPKTN